MEPKTVRRDRGGLSARHIESPQADNRLVAGTTVLTLDGALPVEFLSPGDRVITRDSGTATLRTVERAATMLPLIAIRAGTLGKARPEGDIRLPEWQEVLVRDWRAAALFGASSALVPALRLVDGTYIRALGPVEVETLRLVFDAPHILYAEGLELASGQVAMSPA